jgi:hypothetical protein
VGAFEQAVLTLQELDMFRLGFPFILVFSLMYGVLRKYEFFEDQNVTAVASVSFAFISVGGIYSFVPSGLLTSFGAIVALSVFFVFGLILTLAVAGTDLDEYLGSETEYPVILGAGLVVIGLFSSLWYFLPVESILGLSGLKLPNIPEGFVNGALALAVVVGVVGLVLYGDKGLSEEQQQQQESEDQESE